MKTDNSTIEQFLRDSENWYTLDVNIKLVF